MVTLCEQTYLGKSYSFYPNDLTTWPVLVYLLSASSQKLGESWVGNLAIRKLWMWPAVQQQHG